MIYRDHEGSMGVLVEDYIGDLLRNSHMEIP